MILLLQLKNVTAQNTLCFFGGGGIENRGKDTSDVDIAVFGKMIPSRVPGTKKDERGIKHLSQGMVLLHK